jgi:alpha-L-rhamnosidase
VFFAYSTDLVARAARVLGKEEDARTYSDLLARIKEAFCREFVTPADRIGGNTQTAYVLALMFDLVPEAQRLLAARRLADDIRRRGNHLSSGFVGTSYLPHVLTRFGYLDTAYALLNQETYPSWLYPIKLGATTIWERWDGIKPNGEFQDPGMNSFNHYAYGAIGDWLYRVVAGIEVDPDAPGYKHILIQPQPGGGLTHAAATLRSMYGEVGSEWELSDGRFRLIATVPANTTATVRLLCAALTEVTEGGVPLGDAVGVKRVTQDGDTVVVEVGSGRYEFSYLAPALAERSRPRLTIDSKVRDLVGDEKARAVLEKHAPGVTSSSQLDQALEFTLTQVAAFVPHVFTREVLEAIGKDLAKLQ